MLATNANNGQLIQPGGEEILLEWTADGQSYFLGYMATGSYSGFFKLHVQKPNDPQPTVMYPYYTSPSGRTAYVVDRLVKYPAGTIVRLTVAHDSASAETFYATFLGGLN